MATRGEVAQATPLVLALIIGACATSAVGFGVAGYGLAAQRSQLVADASALSAAKALWLGSDRQKAESVAVRSALLNGVAKAHVITSKSSDPLGSIRLKVESDFVLGGGSVRVPIEAESVAEVADWAGGGLAPGPGDYSGPFAWRQGKPMRPDTAQAFDRVAAAAARAGVSLQINSAWRSTAEQAALFAAHPDPKWVAPPGHSLHRLGTELDLGPDSAYGWLSAHAGEFGFLQRYSWEPWHFGYVRSPGSASVGFGRKLAGANSSGGALQPWVPPQYRAMILDASRRRGVSAALLAAQIRAESDFQPDSVSSAGAEGISQLMPDEASRFHVNPFHPAEAIDAQARLMREHLARFASVPLALAAYNAGPNAVARCGCVPPYPETQAYVRRILSWLHDGAVTIVRLVA